VDQDLTSGNRGYLMGNVSESASAQEKKTTRTIQAIEIELHPPIKFERMPKEKTIAPQPSTEETTNQETWGNRGYITQSVAPLVQEPGSMGIEKYTVQKNDTLQKISQHFYGTTKKWNKIYEANKDVLKGPNKIYPGQVINVPVESVKENKENLK
jgi:nucleoid-associated protein YgaU